MSQAIITQLQKIINETCANALTVTEDTATTTVVKLYSAGGVALSAEETLASGSPVYKFDVLHITITGGTFAVTGATLVSEGYYRVDGGTAVVVTATDEA